ncbi:hypothetical protein AYI68_g5774 [Smittium mucronatum]|uniref:Uncharacterized protein n=1 Tax=Smittium mucronatum TaxID=133383 RepID=A0A1R0GTD1_9FUNG|nr:hypothetical protein AYI68_g5774 [Smittium mucronatum]
MSSPKYTVNVSNRLKSWNAGQNSSFQFNNRKSMNKNVAGRKFDFKKSSKSRLKHEYVSITSNVNSILSDLLSTAFSGSNKKSENSAPSTQINAHSILGYELPIAYSPIKAPKSDSHRITISSLAYKDLNAFESKTKRFRTVKNDFLFSPQINLALSSRNPQSFSNDLEFSSFSNLSREFQFIFKDLKNISLNQSSFLKKFIHENIHNPISSGISSIPIENIHVLPNSDFNDRSHHIVHESTPKTSQSTSLDNLVFNLNTSNTQNPINDLIYRDCQSYINTPQSTTKNIYSNSQSVKDPNLIKRDIISYNLNEMNFVQQSEELDIFNNHKKFQMSTQDLKVIGDRVKEFISKKVQIKGNKLYSQVHLLISNLGRDSFMEYLGEYYFHVLFDAFHRRSRLRSYTRAYNNNHLLEYMCSSAFTRGWRLTHSETLILMYHFIKTKQLFDAINIFNSIRDIVAVDKLVLDDAWRRADMSILLFQERMRYYQMYNLKLYSGIVSSLISELCRHHKIEMVIKVYNRFKKKIFMTKHLQQSYFDQIAKMKRSDDYLVNNHGDFIKVGGFVGNFSILGQNKVNVVPFNKLGIRVHSLNSLMLMCLSRNLPRLGSRFYIEITNQFQLKPDLVTLRNIICGTANFSDLGKDSLRTLLVPEFIDGIIHHRYKSQNIRSFRSSSLNITENYDIDKVIQDFKNGGLIKENLFRTWTILTQSIQHKPSNFEKEFILGLLVMWNEYVFFGISSLKDSSVLGKCIEHNLSNSYLERILFKLFLSF